MKRKAAAKRNLYVTPLGSGWAVKEEGKADFRIITDRKSEALAFAKQVASQNNSEVIIHGKDGSIQQKNTQTKRDVSVVGN